MLQGLLQLKMTGKRFIFIFLGLFFLSFVSSMNVSNENYSVGIVATGLQTSNSFNGNYNGVIFLGWFFGGTGNSNSTNYQLNVGPLGKFLGPIISPIVLPYCGDGVCDNEETCSSCAGDCGICGGNTGGGSGGGGTPEIIQPKCTIDLDCGDKKYCSNGECLVAECFENKECSKEKACWNHKCVKLFDVKITDFKSPVKLGEFFEFSYFLKGMADISNDVRMDFRIESEDGKNVSSGSDVIFVGNFEQKTEQGKIYIPENIASGNYKFYVDLNFENYHVGSYRTISILVKDGEAEIKGAPLMNLTQILIIAVVLLTVLVVILIFIVERKRKKMLLRREGLMSKKHKFTKWTIFIVTVIFVIGFFLKGSIANLFRKMGYGFQEHWWFDVLAWVGNNFVAFFSLCVIIAIFVMMLWYFFHRRKRRKNFGY